ALFLPIGSPTLLMERSEYSDFLRELGIQMHYPERRPTCIVCVSARWISETEEVKVMSSPSPKTVHDFFGFAESLYQVQYLARGDAEFAAQVGEALERWEIPWKFDGTRGYDLGCWSPLSLIFPAADVPILQVSLSGNLDEAFHVRLGKALGELRDCGFLLVCTGGVTHSLLDLSFGESDPNPAWQSADEAWDARSSKLCSWNKHKDDNIRIAASSSHPTREHFLPLLVASGSGGPRS
ncbi:hypothetical protein GUITHDRAFT_50144, partial [Guillardia theta CCMP2712]